MSEWQVIGLLDNHADLAQGIAKRGRDLRMDANARGRKITLRASPLLKNYRAAVDGVRIEEVVVNLIDNAVKYSPADIAIDVDLTSTPDAIRIAGRDRGSGIPPAERTRIFEPFRRSSATAPGVGLGLHIAKEIVELHGGTLTVEAPVDGGSLFVVTMPRHADPRPEGAPRG